MCGAISIKYDEQFHKQLQEFFTAAQIEDFKDKGEIIFAYWDKHPVLPVRQGKDIRFIDWGNKNNDLPLPKTGWARLESLLEKKWDKYKPKVVRIPAMRGCEKKIWFDLDNDIKAVLVEKNGHQRVYMITEAATPDYLESTGHERMPRLMPAVEANSK